MLRHIAAIAALCFGAAATAQTTSPAATQVQLLAPQLVAFSGSSANFESLVNGLTQNTPVTLTTVGADGLVQIVTFLPGTTLSAADTARLLETARQNLIVRGVATPTAQQLATALVGGSLQTSAGLGPINGLLPSSNIPLDVRNVLAQPGTGAGSGANGAGLSAANLQALRAGLAQGTPVTLSGAGGSVTFGAPPGPPLSPFEVNQALQLAAVLLAQQGIVDPTPQQLRAALFGGNLATASGAVVALQGVLQGRVRNTSDSPIGASTSDSPLFGTSDSRAVGTSNTAPAAGPGTRSAAPISRTPLSPARPFGAR